VITGAVPNLIVRGFGIFYNFLLLTLSYACLRRFNLARKGALVAALVVVFSYYLEGVLTYTSIAAFIFYVLIFALVVAPYKCRTTSTLLIVVFFSAMVITHAFTPFVVVSALSVMLLGWKPANRLIDRLGLSMFRGNPLTTRRSVLVLLVIIVTVYWVYFASTIFLWGTLKLSSRSILELFAGPVSGYFSTRYSKSYASVVELYAPVLAAAFVLYLLSLEDERKLQLVLWILGLWGSLLVTVVGYIAEFLPRTFGYATLPMSYAVGRLFQSHRRHIRPVAIAVLLATLSLHIPAHYGQDAFMAVQNSTVQGLQFFAVHSSESFSIESPWWQLSDYFVNIYRSSNASGEGSGLYFLMSYQARSWVLYSSGNGSLQALTEDLTSSRYNQVLTCGYFNAYLQT
jgi:hypothetical protein